MHKEYSNKQVLFFYNTVVKRIHHLKLSTHSIISKVRNFNSIYSNVTFKKAKDSISIVKCGDNNSEFYMVNKRPGLLEDIIAQDKNWEENISYLLLFLLRKGGLFFDVGSNIGYHSLYLLSKRDDISCIAFEPNDEIFKILVRNIMINNFSNRARPVKSAVGRTNGKATFFSQSGQEYNRGLSSLSKNGDLGSFSEVNVDLTTLDEYFYSRNNLKDILNVVIKIDVQGNEMGVLLGAKKIINELNPSIVFELDSGYINDFDDEVSQIEKVFPEEYSFYIISTECGELYPIESLKKLKKDGEYNILALCFEKVMER